jgi:hypothetical protein
MQAEFIWNTDSDRFPFSEKIKEEIQIESRNTRKIQLNINFKNTGIVVVILLGKN